MSARIRVLRHLHDKTEHMLGRSWDSCLAGHSATSDADREAVVPQCPSVRKGSDAGRGIDIYRACGKKNRQLVEMKGVRRCDRGAGGDCDFVQRE